MGSSSRAGMSRRSIVTFLLVLFLPLAGQAALFLPTATAANEQDGDITGDTDQEGDSSSGDANAGQITGVVVNGGNTQLDATNSSRDVSVESGEASGNNTANSFVGQAEIGEEELNIGNYQDGDNESNIAQAANAASGDAVGGQVIGVVASGDTDIVASNSSEDVDVVTGDADVANDANVFVGLFADASDEGLQLNICFPILTFCDNDSDVSANNTQGSDNSSDLSQAADAASGDGVGGQVIGVVSPGNTTIDATNSSRDVDIETGDASASNDAEVAAGLVAAASNEGLQLNICGLPIESQSLPLAVCINSAEANADNNQDGDNASDIAQAAEATSGDGVGGQVIGVVSSAGATDITAANTSEDVDIETGDAASINSALVDVGPRASATNVGVQANICGNAIASSITLTTPICVNNATADAVNTQEGDNASDLAQAADATSGDGVGGQVIGVVSSGNTTIDATNSSKDIDIETGDAVSSNAAVVLVRIAAIAANDGTQANVCGNQIDTSGLIVPSISNSTCINFADASGENHQDGDNTSELSQAANATSGDGVGGQVIGAVTSGTTDIVAANTSENVDIETGDADSSNFALNDVGPVPSASNEGTQVNLCGNQIGVLLSFSESTCVNASVADASIDQTGDNESALSQSASATTGDGVGGQVIGAVSSGSTSIDATNSSLDIDIETGDADASNTANVVAGPTSVAENVGTQANLCANQLDFIDGEGIDGDRAFADATCINLGVADAELVQEGDNESDLTQSASATTGDGIGGQVIGAVTSGTTDIVAANTSEDVDISTGDADAANAASVIAGATSLAGNDGTQANVCANQLEPNGGSIFFGNEVEAEAFCLNAAIAVAENEQTGDNSSDLAQAADATTGDGVGGQVIGAVSAGDTSIDATNSSDDVDIVTGDADSSNNADVVVGALAETTNEGLQLNLCGNQLFTEDDSTTDAICINFALGAADNDQNGDNASDVSQSAGATTGDGVGGQVIGAVTSGTADIVAANTSEDVDIVTGDADANNDAVVAVGLDAATDNEGVQANVCANQIGADESDAAALCINAAIVIAENEHEGDNSVDVAQAADATTGDGVGGQVIGVVSSGTTSVDATNRSEDVDIETGSSDASNDADVVVGLIADAGNEGAQINPCGNQDGDIFCLNFDIALSGNEQEGDNESVLTQSANASSGDAVGGQVIGSVAPDGGSSDIVAANTSRDIDAVSGPADQDNSDEEFVGLQNEREDLMPIF